MSDMSEELEWELFDIFESGLFAFPIWDHKSARQIVRYLLHRGVFPEEIADAIEDTTFDLEVWLKQGGKSMVGEWVIAWVNDTREEYQREKPEVHEPFLPPSRAGSPDSYTTCTSDPGDQDDDSETELKRVDTFQSELNDNDRVSTPGTLQRVSTTRDIDDEDVLDEGTTNRPKPPPLPQPNTKTISDTSKEETEAERIVEEFLQQSYVENIYETGPDTPGMMQPPALFSCVPSVDLPQLTQGYDSDTSCSTCNATNIKVASLDRNGLPVCKNCTCTIPLYSYISRIKDTTEYNDNFQIEDIFFKDTGGTNITKAMEFNFETLEIDCPGFIFIMTDSINNGLSWSADHRYKIASSRQPERCLLEFRSRNIPIELIWQIKVQHHLKAVKEVHVGLQSYNLHTNWFKCTLGEIMDTVAKVAQKYKSV